MVHRWRRVFALIALTIAAISGFIVTSTATAGASYPVGTVITFPNVAAPGGTVSCWENQVNTSASRINCYKYNFAGTVVQTWEGTMPWFCKGIVLLPGNAFTSARLEIANKFWGESIPNSQWAGGHGGCGLGFNQSGSQAWAHNYVTPAGCLSSISCTNNVGTLAGGSWWGPNTSQHPVSRSQGTGYNGIQWPNGQTYRSFVYFG